MAELTVEELQKQLAAEQAKNAELAKSAEAANAVLPIEGEYTAKWKDPAGKTVSKKVAFVNGHKGLRIGGIVYPTTEVLKAANGKESKYIDQAAAEKFLTHLAKIGYAYLK